MSEQQDKNGQITYSQEILRKLFHLGAIIIPLIYSVVERDVILIPLLIITTLIVFIDFYRHYNQQLQDLCLQIFGNMIRTSELKKLSGLSFTFLAACISILMFPKMIAITALCVAAVADAAASIIGRKYGKKRFMDKSIEGSLAFIFSGMIVVFTVAWLGGQDILFAVTGVLAVCVAAVIEASAKFLHIDDNFAVPIIIGFFMGVLL